MAYTKTEWVDYPSETTPINATNLNHIEQGIYDNDQAFLTNGLNISNEVDEDYRVNLLEGKNLFDANNVLNGMGIASGGTITSATDNGLFYIPVVVGKTYVFSFTDNGVSGNIVWGYTSSKPVAGGSCTYNVMTNANLNGATFTPTGTQKYLCIRLNTTANNQYNAMSNIQCEEGSTATSYEAFIPNQIVVDNEKYSDTLNVGQLDSRSRVNVLYSKNKFGYYLTGTGRGVDFSYNGSEISLNGTSASEGPSITWATMMITLDAGTYTFSWNKMSGSKNNNNQSIVVRNINGSTNVIDATFTDSGIRTFTLSSKADISVVVYYLGSGCSFTNYKFNVQIEKGAKSTTSYEPYITPSIYVDNEEIYRKDNLDIVDITNDITFETGWSFEATKIYKQGKRIFGTIVAVRSSNMASGTSYNEVIYLNHNLKSTYIMSGFTATGTYEVSNGSAYIYIGNTGKITFATNSTCNRIRFQLEVVEA